MEEPATAPITSEDMARFHRNAPAALARRGGNFVGEELAAAFEWILTGAVPIVGMLTFDWSAAQLLLFLLVGAWTAILLDFVKLALFYGAVKRFGATHYDDWHVWVVATALREGRTEAPRSHLKAKYQPEMGVLVDLLFGGVGTAAIIAAVASVNTGGLGELLADRTVWYGLAGVVGYQVAFAAFEMARRWSDREDSAMKVAVGMRGLGLFLLMFVVVMIRESAGENGSGARAVMLAVNGHIIAWGAFNIVGQVWVSRETRWLRDHLEQHRRDERPERPRRRKRS